MTFRTAGLILARAGEAGAFVEFERLWLDADHVGAAERVALDAFLDAAEELVGRVVTQVDLVEARLHLAEARSPRGLFIDAACRVAERLSHQ